MANKYSTTARDKIVETVVKFYVNFDEINDAKKLLYEKTNKNFTTHHEDDKSSKTALDIVETFVACDNSGTSLLQQTMAEFPSPPMGLSRLNKSCSF